MDITELDEMIVRQLDLTDLPRCARVSKKWYRTFVPFLWRDLSHLPYTNGGGFVKLARLVLEDYILEQQHQNSLKATHGKQQQQQQQQQALSTIPPLPPRRLAKYCQWIRLLPSAESLYTRLETLWCSHPLQEEITSDLVLAPTNGTLLHHLYKQCPNLQIDYWNFHTNFILREIIFKTVAEYIVPHTRHLHIGQLLFSNELPAWKIKYLLSRCSGTLEELTLEAKVEHSETDTEYHQAESGPWTRLKRLNLVAHRGDPYPKAFWKWLWSRCGEVEQLRVRDGTYIRQCLVEGILAHMPKLTRIHLEACSSPEDAEALLYTSRQGWKEVVMERNGYQSRCTIRPLMNSVTLERLVLDGVYGITDKEKVELLACCPNLREFTDINAARVHGETTQGFDARCFIDFDSEAEELRPWMCEASLRVLKIRIHGIPRPDLKGEIDYLGYGHEIQHQVYDRLARFTKLETLWLGGNYDYRATCCLEMSLESGLDRIAGLKELKELNVSYMRTRIGKQEIKWMLEQWPKLSVIYGLIEKGRDMKAAKWLRYNRPEIIL
ncbi:MAG: hypothetical protein J3Q66DRAFT_351059, partial [Benniella sp.]